VARADGAPLAAVASGGAATISLPVKVDLLRAGQAAAALARGGEVDVALRGEARVAGLPLPLDLAARLPARR
jgi:hypothetical protein